MGEGGRFSHVMAGFPPFGCGTLDVINASQRNQPAGRGEPHIAIENAAITNPPYLRYVCKSNPATKLMYPNS